MQVHIVRLEQEDKLSLISSFTWVTLTERNQSAGHGGGREHGGESVWSKAQSPQPPAGSVTLGIPHSVKSLILFIKRGF